MYVCIDAFDLIENERKETSWCHFPKIRLIRDSSRYKLLFRKRVGQGKKEGVDRNTDEMRMIDLIPPHFSTSCSCCSQP
jgi:hypothetical protein